MDYKAWLKQVTSALDQVEGEEMGSREASQILSPLVKRGYICLQNLRTASDDVVQETFDYLDREDGSSFLSFAFLSNVLSCVAGHVGQEEAQVLKVLVSRVDEVEKALKKRENVCEPPARRSLVHRSF